ncbi:MAG TPA: TOMM precursor leader peptide-binding protein, partial [Pseudonocardiaceae bacterium]|nr:TOMM precursor leader peptide-binding protein [Pseudonocardiaceae bacterium]
MSGAEDPVTWPVGFRRHLRVETADGATYLLAEHQVTVLHGSHIAALAPLLDGTRTIPELVRDPPAGMTPQQVGATVRELAGAGLVGLHAPAAGDVDTPALVYWATAGLDVPGIGKSGVDGRVQLITLGDTDISATELALRDAALSIVPTGVDADLSVVLCTDYLDPRLADIDRQHRSAGRPWLLAKPVGTQPWLGPVFQPDLGCWHCLADRLRRHRPVDTILARSGVPTTRPVAAIAPLTVAAGGLIALEATKWLAGYRYPGQQTVCTVDSLTLHTRHHELRVRPQCAHCGDPSMMRAIAWRPIELTPRPTADTSSGGHRLLPPERILARYQHLISPVTGVIKEIRRDTRGPEFFNVFRSGPNIAIGSQGLDALRSTLRAENGGKGITPLQAEVGALCEAIERYSGTFHGDEERVQGSLRSLGEPAIHPNRCQLFHERQYPNRAAWNSTHGSFQRIPEPFDEQAVTDWTPVWSLTHERHRLLPTAMLYFAVPDGPLRADSNGNAAGGTLEDALLQGLLELVERDAVALWWYNRTRAPGVDLDAFTDPWIDELRTVHTGLNR